MIVHGSKPHKSLTRFAGSSIVGPDPPAVCHHVWIGRTRIRLPFEFPRRKAVRPWLFWKVPRVIQPARGFQRACIAKWKLEERLFWKSERCHFAWKSTLTSESYHDGKFLIIDLIIGGGGEGRDVNVSIVLIVKIEHLICYININSISILY